METMGESVNVEVVTRLGQTKVNLSAPRGYTELEVIEYILATLDNMRRALLNERLATERAEEQGEEQAVESAAEEIVEPPEVIPAHIRHFPAPPPGHPTSPPDPPCGSGETQLDAEELARLTTGWVESDVEALDGETAIKSTADDESAK